VKTTPLAALFALALLAGCASDAPAGPPAPRYAPSPPPVIYAPPPVSPEPENDGVVVTANATAPMGVAHGSRWVALGSR
jgi:hypothetical protein